MALLHDLSGLLKLPPHKLPMALFRIASEFCSDPTMRALRKLAERIVRSRIQKVALLSTRP